VIFSIPLRQGQGRRQQPLSECAAVSQPHGTWETAVTGAEGRSHRPDCHRAARCYYDLCVGPAGFFFLDAPAGRGHPRAEPPASIVAGHRGITLASHGHRPERGHGPPSSLTEVARARRRHKATLELAHPPQSVNQRVVRCENYKPRPPTYSQIVQIFKWRRALQNSPKRAGLGDHERKDTVTRGFFRGHKQFTGSRSTAIPFTPSTTRTISLASIVGLCPGSIHRRRAANCGSRPRNRGRPIFRRTLPKFRRIRVGLVCPSPLNEQRKFNASASYGFFVQHARAVQPVVSSSIWRRLSRRAKSNFVVDANVLNDRRRLIRTVNHEAGRRRFWRSQVTEYRDSTQVSTGYSFFPDSFFFISHDG